MVVLLTLAFTMVRAMAVALPAPIVVALLLAIALGILSPVLARRQYLRLERPTPRSKRILVGRVVSDELLMAVLIYYGFASIMHFPEQAGAIAAPVALALLLLSSLLRSSQMDGVDRSPRQPPSED